MINLVTRRGRDVHGAEASTAAASYDTYTGRLSYGKRFTNGLEMLFSGTILESEGQDAIYYPEFSDSHGGMARHSTVKASSNCSARFRTRIFRWKD